MRLLLLRWTVRAMVIASGIIGFIALIGVVLEVQIQTGASSSFLTVEAHGATARPLTVDHTPGHAPNHALGHAANKDTAHAPVLVEMFLSQSCSSCVPAARYMADLASRDDVVTLSWHVDYWDRLNVPGHGRWKDPYSDSLYTARQRDFARSVFQTSRVYTPQVVVNGQAETVGSRRADVERLISTQSNVASADQSFSLGVGDDGWTIGIDNPDTDYQVTRVDFLKQTRTSIRGGENDGVDWREANVVSQVKSLGTLTQQKPDLIIQSVSFDDSNIGCAILVRNSSTNAVSARYCPS